MPRRECFDERQGVWKCGPNNVLVKSAYDQVAHQVGGYAGFYSMKRLGVFLLPPGWDASPLQGYA